MVYKIHDVTPNISLNSSLPGSHYLSPAIWNSLLFLKHVTR